MWGSAVRGDNWQCGVLLSDDGGRTLRYRQVGYEPDPAIRKDPKVMAGFNDRRGARPRSRAQSPMTAGSMAIPPSG